MKEQQAFELVQSILESHGDFVDDISIHESGDFIEGVEEGYRVYCSEGFCWEISRERYCETEEAIDYSDVDGNGFSYSFGEPWDDFNQSGIDKAIEKLKMYAG